ncbi:hypothetical protein CO2235_100050 [Cupriavidus oxalaticus]|uniref:Uncharacterized protein n=1 Tax=Cupriavidus oxalaticus TaxID=96344 RepID=A0A976G8H9_9BURK|nr:hypothetical protein CO2235_100050 [Cupriavidus oxalaticus]
MGSSSTIRILMFRGAMRVLCECYAAATPRRTSIVRLQA